MFLNGKRIPVHNFREYVELYRLDQQSVEFFHEEVNNR